MTGAGCGEAGCPQGDGTRLVGVGRASEAGGVQPMLRGRETGPAAGLPTGGRAVDGRGPAAGRRPDGEPAGPATWLGRLGVRPGELVRRAMLDRAGVSPREIAASLDLGELERVRRGIYRALPSDDLPDGRYLARARAVHLLDPDRVITGTAAVALLGLPVIGRPASIHVALDGRGGASRRSIARTTARPPTDQVMWVPSGSIATPARAALDAARLDSLRAGVVAADAALVRGMTTPDELDRVARSMAGLRGVGRARLCSSLASAGSQSPGESWSAVVLHGHGVPSPQRQVEIHDALGLIGRVDFWWPLARVAGEFDGRVKYGRQNLSGRPPEEVLWDEKRREDRLRATGVQVVRWTAADLHHPADWLARLRAALSSPG